MFDIFDGVDSSDLPCDEWDFDPDDPVLRAAADLICPVVEFDPAQDASPDDEALLLAQLASLEARIASLQADQATVIAALDRADFTPERWAHEAISVALKVSPVQARSVVARARSLVDNLPRTLAAFARGELSQRKADLISEASWRLPHDVLALFEDRVLKRAATQTPRQLALVIKRASIALDPAREEQRRQRAQAERGVHYAVLGDGQAELRLVHSADAIQAVRARLDAVASTLPHTDDRTIDQQRADLLVDAVLASLSDEVLPAVRGRRPSVHVVVQASTLLGADEDPAHLRGYGSITAQMARAIAADPTGTWHRLLTDPSTGHLLDAGTRTYRPSQHLIDYLNARDDGCSFPTCHAPAERCEVEHCVPFDPDSGGTEPSNTALTCRRHNEIKKADSPWRYVVNDDQTTTWTHRGSGLTVDNMPIERWKVPDEGEVAPPF